MTPTLLSRMVRLLFLVAILGLIAFMAYVLRHDDRSIADGLSLYIVLPTYLVWLFKKDFWTPRLTKSSFLGPLACLSVLCCLFCFGLFQWAIRSSATRARIANDLKQIGNALEDYQEKNGSLPPAFTQSPDGKPLLSWRVLLLPYLEESKLFKRFHLDEPWDSPHNLALIQDAPRIYSNLELASPNAGMTFYRVFGGPDTLFPPGKSINTKHDVVNRAEKAVVLEASEAVPWTKPETLLLDQPTSSPRFGATRIPSWPLHWSNWRCDIFGCLMADNSVEFLPTDLTDNDLAKMLRPATQPNSK